MRPLPPPPVPGTEVTVLAAIIPRCPPASYGVFHTRPIANEAPTTIAAALTMGPVQPVLFVSVPRTLRGGAGPPRANFGTRRPESLDGLKT